MDFIADMLKQTQSSRQCDDATVDKDTSFPRLPSLFTGNNDTENGLDGLKNGFDFASALSFPQTSIQGLLHGSDSIFLPSSTNSSFAEQDTVQKTNAQVIELQNKLVCLQQQLNAAVTANYTKNIMIEQLDKVLARIMEGWKKHEAEKSAKIVELEKECDDTKETLGKERNVLIKTEEELGQTLEKLMVCQREILGAQEEKHRLVASHQAEMNKLEEAFQTKESHLQEIASKLQDTVNEQEEVIKALKEQIQMEKECRQILEAEKNESLEKTLSGVHRLQQDLITTRELANNFEEDAQKLKLELDDVRREKESLKVELGITQDRIEAEKRAQEIRLKQEFAVVIKELDVRLDKVHEKLTSDHVDELEKAHAKHLQAVESEIQKRVQLEAQLREEFQVKLQETSDDLKVKLNDSLNKKERRLQELSTKLLQLQQTNDMLASGRSQLMSKFQELLQSQWQEALQILYGKVDSAAMLNLDYHLPSGCLTQNHQHESGSVQNNALDFNRILAGLPCSGSSPRCRKLHSCCGANHYRNEPKTCQVRHSLQITPRKAQPGKENNTYNGMMQHSPNTTGAFLFDVNHCSPLSSHTDTSCYHQFPNAKSMSPLSAVPKTSEFSQMLPGMGSNSNIYDWLCTQPNSQRASAPNCSVAQYSVKLPLPKTDHQCTTRSVSEQPVSQGGSLYHSCISNCRNAEARNRNCDRGISNLVASQQLSNKSTFCDSGIGVAEDNSHVLNSVTSNPTPTPDVSAIGFTSKNFQGSFRSRPLASREGSHSSSDAEGHNGQRNPNGEEKRVNRRYPFSTPMHEYVDNQDRKKKLHSYLEKLLQKPPRNVHDSLDTEPCRETGKL